MTKVQLGDLFQTVQNHEDIRRVAYSMVYERNPIMRNGACGESNHE